MTSNSQLRSNMGLFYGEGLIVPQNNAGAEANVYVTPFGGICLKDAANAVDVNPMGHPWDATMGGFNPNTPYDQYPDLGGIIMGAHNMAVNTGTTGVNGAAVDFTNFK